MTIKTRFIRLYLDVDNNIEKIERDKEERNYIIIEIVFKATIEDGKITVKMPDINDASKHIDKIKQQLVQIHDLLKAKDYIAIARTANNLAYLLRYK